MFMLAMKILGLMILAGAVGYLLGSFPTAYVLVRWKTSKDIRSKGSGNVGTLNSYVVTKSKLLGATVLIIDFLKGAAAVAVVGLFVDGFIYLAAAGVGAVLGHTFPVWLGFKGGRGLATSAGVMVSLGWIVVVVWAVLWVLGFLITRNVNVGNAIASVISLVLILAAPASVLMFAKPNDASIAHFKYFVVLLFGVVIIKHIEPVTKYVAEKTRRQA